MNNFKTTKKIVPIDQIVANRWNPNVQAKSMFEKGVNSVKELGMLGSILVRETAGCFEILDGEHRWKYMKELGYTECPVESMGEIDDKDAKLLTVLLNNIKGKDDIEKRAKLYEQLEAGQLALLPFSEEEIANEKALFKFDFGQYEKKVKEAEGEKEKFRIIIIDVHEEEYKLWQFVKKYAEKEEQRDEKDLLVKMIKDYLAVRLGSSEPEVKF